ncbi:unnamed protein product [Ambrosiozyma monospora]|uniref:Unnamed protein product n=1 Tax=Ambrosiozyma monospora TaxID=43982 RepID=A0ACB5SSC7_AMBMO|nr:unnamed protein product [Ambrosiozyma monospora]
MLRYQVLRRALSLKTTINPQSTLKLTQPPNHQALLLLTTPHLLNSTIDTFVNLTSKESPEQHSIQKAAVICVDSILQCKNAVSEVWLDVPDQLRIMDYVVKDDEVKNEPKPRTSEADPIKLDKNWKDGLTDTQLSLNLFSEGNIEDKLVNLKLNLGRSLFVNGLESTCFTYHNPTIPEFTTESKLNFVNLQKLTIGLRLPSATPVKFGEKSLIQSKYTNQFIKLPFEPNEDDVYVVDSHVGNLIKRINFKPASGYLIENPNLNDSKDHSIWVKLSKYDPDTATVKMDKPTDEYYRVIVGGSGWDAEKMAMLGIDPIVGDGLDYKKQIKLYEVSKEKNVLSLDDTVDVSKKAKFVVECSEADESFSQFDDKLSEKVIDGVVGFGSENGFQYDEVWHKAPNELVEVDVSTC